MTGHPDRVKTISFSPDGQIMVSISGLRSSSTIKIWQSQDGTLLASTPSYGTAEKVIFSPDGNTILTSGYSEVAQLWSLNGLLMNTLEGHNDVINDSDFSPDGKTLATGSADNTIRLTKRDGTGSITLRGHKAGVTNVRFSPNGKMLISASSDNAVKLWTLDGKELKSLQEPTKESDENNFSRVSDVRFSSDSQNVFLIENGRDSKVKLWSISGKEIRTLKSSREKESDKIDFNQDDKSIAIVVRENDLKLWNLDGKLVSTFRDHTAQINATSFSRDGNFLVSASDDKTVKLWQSDGKLLKTLQHEDKVNSASFSLDGKLIASGSDDKAVKLWQTDDKLLKTLQHTDKVNSVSFSSDGKFLASASDDKTVKLWRSDGTILKTLKHDDKVKTVSFSPDSKFLASASKDGTVKLWSNDGQEVTVIKGTSNSQPIIRFSPDSKMLAIRDSEYSQEFKLHMIDSIWAKNNSISLNTQFSDLLFSPDGKSIAVATGNDVQFLDFTLDSLLGRGCNWIQDYLKHNPNVDKSDRHLCDDIPTRP